MSLQTIVSSGFVGRLHPRPAPARIAAQPRARDIAIGINVGSMRILETGIAVTALATAVLIGLGR